MDQEISPKCKYCDSSNMKRYGTYNGEQLWWCDDCKRKQTGKDTLFKMRFPSDQIATALRLYYEGLSLDAIKEEFEHQFGVTVATSTLYEWIQAFTNAAIAKSREFKPEIGDDWIADETAIVVRGKADTGSHYDRYYWLLDVIDAKTRFLLATRISTTRSIADVEEVMNDASRKAGKSPSRILTDKMQGYPQGIKIAFDGKVKHVQTSPFVHIDHTNVVERFHGTIKDRIKVLRGFKSADNAKQILDGWLVYYNFFRPHESLGGKSPAENMHVKLPFGSWDDIVRNTKEREAKPEPQAIVIPRSQQLLVDDDLRRLHQREVYKDWYYKHHTPKYKPRKPKLPKQVKPTKSVQPMIGIPRKQKP
jgi:putative transposase